MRISVSVERRGGKGLGAGTPATGGADPLDPRRRLKTGADLGESVSCPLGDFFAKGLKVSSRPADNEGGYFEYPPMAPVPPTGVVAGPRPDARQLCRRLARAEPQSLASHPRPGGAQDDEGPNGDGRPGPSPSPTMTG